MLYFESEVFWMWLLLWSELLDHKRLDLFSIFENHRLKKDRNRFFLDKTKALIKFDSTLIIRHPFDRTVYSEHIKSKANMCRRLVKMLHKGSGVGTYFERTKKAIRLVNRGCTNRPFYHIVVAEVSLLLNVWCWVCLILTISNDFLLNKTCFSIPEFPWGKRSGNRTSRLIWSNVEWTQRKFGCIKFWTNSMVAGRRCIYIKTGCWNFR